MRTRIYLNGKPDWTDNEPARARVAGYGGSAIGHTLTPMKPQPRSVVPLREKDRRRKAQQQRRKESA